jgi:hypothetical protein
MWTHQFSTFRSVAVTSLHNCISTLQVCLCASVYVPIDDQNLKAYAKLYTFTTNRGRLEQLVSSWACDQKVAGSNPDWTLTIFWAPLPSTGSLVSDKCDQPPLICFDVCGRKAVTKLTHFDQRIGKDPTIFGQIIIIILLLFEYFYSA